MSSPIIVLDAPAETFVGQTERFDCRDSSGLFKRPQADGSPSFRISYGDGDESRLVASGHAYRTAGTYVIQVIAKSIGGVTTPAMRQIIVKDIPRATIENTQILKDSGDIWINGTLLQDAINLAASRNWVEQEIIIPAGFKAAGTIFTTKPVGNCYITLRSTGIDSLPVNQRVTLADEPLLFQILSVDGKEALSGPFSDNGTHHYCFRGMKLGQKDSTQYVHHLSHIGSPGGPYEVERLARCIIWDQCWVDGGPNDTDQIRSGASIWASQVTIKNSHFAEFRRIGGGVDSQAFGITIGGECYSFDNNYLSATSESVNLGAGGAAYLGRATVSQPTTTSCVLSNVKNLQVDMNLALQVNGKWHVAQSTIVRAIDGNRVTYDPIFATPDEGGTAEWEVQPSFIEFRRNWSFKPLKWWSKHPSSNGISYQIKNHYETKFSRYTVVDSNIFENGWQADQSYAVALSPKNISGGESFASVVREFQFTNNEVMNCAKGINIVASDYNPGDGVQPISTQLLSDVHIDNVLFSNVGVNWDPSGAGHQMITMQNPYNVRMKRIFINHITDDSGMPANEGRAISDFGDMGGADESTWTNSIHRDGGYGFWSRHGASFTQALKDFYPPGDRTNVHHNLIIDANNHQYPEGFAIGVGWKEQFVDYDGHNYTLSATSLGKGAAADGTDLGVDYAKLFYLTRGCRSGKWTDEAAPLPTPTIPVPTEPVPPPVTPLPIPIVVPSPDGFKGTKIIDAQLNIWTIEDTRLFRNGVQLPGSGTEYKYLSQIVYVHGTDDNWHKSIGLAWEVVMPLGSEPGVVTVPVEPQPVPAPSPTPAPAPQPSPPCSISAPASVSIPKNGSGVIAVTINNLGGPVDVKVIGSDGQVTISELIWHAGPTSTVKQFGVKVKKQSRTITFQSPCGSATVRVNVT